MSHETTSWESDRERVQPPVNDLLGDAADTDHGPDGASSLAREFATLTRSLLAAGTVGEVLTQVVVAARAVVPAAQLVSVTLRSGDGAFHTPVRTDPVAVELDRQQYRGGRGPCVEAARPDGPALAVAEDLSTDRRWPEFADAAARAGFRSVLATTLVPDPGIGSPRLPGALNLYARTRAAFTPADRDRALLLATHASLALATTEAVSVAELERSQLQRAIASRDVIGQAKGILMARRGLSAQEAFDVLRRTSQDTNVKLAEIAATVVDQQHALDGPGPARGPGEAGGH